MRAGAVLLTLVLAACGGDGRSTVRVLEASTWPGADVVSLSVSSCNASPTAEVVASTAREVRVRVEAAPSDDDCADGMLVCLDGPLGGRALVDDSTGEEVSVAVLDAEAIPGCPTA